MRQQKIGYVRAGDQEEKSYGSQQDEQGGTRFAGHRDFEGDYGCVLHQILALLAGGVVNAACDRADLGIGLLDGDSVAEAGNPVVVVRGAAGSFAVAVGGDPDRGFFRELKTVGEDADHGINRVIDFQAQFREVQGRA